jgi:hypothetical protein
MFRICSEMFRICSEFPAIFRICSEFSVMFRIFSESLIIFRTLFRISSTKTDGSQNVFSVLTWVDAY